MKMSLRILGSISLAVVLALGTVAMFHQDAQAARRDYACCHFPVDYDQAGHPILALGVWFDGKCHCVITSGNDNPNGCVLYCGLEF